MRWIVLVPTLLLLVSCSPKPKSVKLVAGIATVTNGYPFALQVRNQLAADLHLMGVFVELDQDSTNFFPNRITYGFASPKTNEPIFAITVDNLQHETFLQKDAPNSAAAHSPHLRSRLDLTQVTQDIPDILTIVRTNGLDGFYQTMPPKDRIVRLSLHDSEIGLVWSVSGEGWNDKGRIVELVIVIDARTGAVLPTRSKPSVSR